MSRIASAAMIKPGISLFTWRMMDDPPLRMTTTTPRGKSLLEGNTILALFAVFPLPGEAAVASAPMGSGVDETGMVVKIVEGPALLKIVLGTLPHQAHPH
jgi:hypothetical protein